MKLTNFILLIILFFPSAAYSDDDQSCCNVNVHETSFGIYNTSSPHSVFAQSAIVIKCKYSITAIVKIDAGENSDGLGNFFPRRMRSTKNTLDYNLYVDAACTKVWGNGASNTYTQQTQVGQTQLIVYGKIPEKQNVSAGNYTDRVTVIVEW